MIKIVMNKATRISTWLGGTCWRERALLIKSNTMATLRKLVMRMMMLGARERRVIRSSSCKEKATSWPLWGFLTVRSTKGTPVFVSGAGRAVVPCVDMPGKGGVCASTPIGATTIRTNKNTKRNTDFHG